MFNISDEINSYPDFEKNNLVIPGLSVDETIIQNEKGGSQSDTPYSFENIPPKPMFMLANIIKYGIDKYGKNNWRKIDTDSHLGHALQHIYAYLAGDKSDYHLAHALTRIVFACELGEELKIQKFKKKVDNNS